MTHIYELSEREVKITMVNMLKTLVEKGDRIKVKKNAVPVISHINHSIIQVFVLYKVPDSVRPRESL